MKGWVYGLVVRVVLGSAATAQGAWQSAAEILRLGNLSTSQTFRTGYIEGIYDTLAALTSLGAHSANDPMSRVMKQMETCLRVHTKGRAQEFLRWADGVWQTNVDQGHGGQSAASLLIADSCN